MSKKEKETKAIDEKNKEKRANALITFLCGVLVAGGAIGGVVISKNHFYSNGYAKGLADYRKNHIDMAKTIIDESGHEAAFQALNFIRKDKHNYEALLNNPEGVIARVHDIYYDSNYVKTMLENYDNELKSMK